MMILWALGLLGGRLRLLSEDGGRSVGVECWESRALRRGDWVGEVSVGAGSGSLSFWMVLGASRGSVSGEKETLGVDETIDERSSNMYGLAI